MLKLTTHRRGLLAASLALVALAFGGAVALADNLVDNVASTTDGKIVSIANGATSGDIGLKLNGAGNDGCDLGAGEAIDVRIVAASGNPTVAAGTGTTLHAADTLRLTDCQAFKYVTLSSTEAGDHAITAQITRVGATVASINNQVGFVLRVGAASTPTDTTPPAISSLLNPAAPDGANGWYRSNVSLSWTVTELQSPLSLIKTGCVDQNITADQTDQTYSCSATSDGGSAGPVNVSIKRDATKPTSTVTGISSSTYGIGNEPTPGCSSNDATSGVATNATPSTDRTGLTVNGVGPVSVACNGAIDNAGNVQTVAGTAGYGIVYGVQSGIGAPINADGSSVFNQKRAVPVKFALLGDAPSGFDVSSWSLIRQGEACEPEAWVDEGLASTTAASTGLRYDPAADQYVANATLAGTTVGKCYRFAVALDDGTRVVSPKFKVGK